MNYGLNLVKERLEQSIEDWVYGASSKRCLAVIPQYNRDTFLPPGEVQRGREDMMDCATRAPINILETKFNYLLRNKLLTAAEETFLRDNGYVTENGIEFSDAFIAILSGTTKDGNSMKATCHAIHKHGLIPKRKLPLLKSMTFEDYHDPSRVTGSLLALGEQSKSYFTIYYEKVYEEAYAQLLQDDMLIVAGHAWPTPKNGVYPRTDAKINHAFALIRKPLHTAFDNYLDTDKDFIKKLAPDYDFLDYGYRLFVSRTENSSIMQNLFQQLALLTKVKDLLISLISLKKKL